MEAKPPPKPGGIDASRLHTKETFVAASLEPEHADEAFGIVTKRFVRIDVDGYVWIKRDSIVAYHGEIKFRRERIFQAEDIGLKSGPLRSALKRELVPLTKAEGKGILFVSDEGNHNQIIELSGGSVSVLATSIVAFQPTLQHEMKLIGGVGILAGGMIMVTLSGRGFVAFGMKGDPLTLRVTPDNPVSCDPTAVLAWSGGLWPELKTNIEIRTLIGHGGGATIQMFFQGEGYVVVHARSRLAAVRSNIFKRTTSKLKSFIR